MPEKFNVFFERISSPISGTFLISWLLWNWEIVYYTFGKSIETHQKIYLINNSLNWSSSFWLPLTSTIGYLVFMPLFLELYGVIQDFYTKLNRKRESKLQMNLVLISKFHYENRYSFIDLLVKALTEYKNKYESLESWIFGLTSMPPGTNLQSIKNHVDSLRQEIDSSSSRLQDIYDGNQKVLEIISLNNSLDIIDEYKSFLKEFIKQYEGKKF